VGVTPRQHRKRRGLKPSDRAHAERLGRLYCQRCGASLKAEFNTPADVKLGLCNWCEHQWHKIIAAYLTRLGEFTVAGKGRATS